MVLIDAAVTTSPAPKTARSASDSQSIPERENPTKAAPARTALAHTTRPRPRTELRIARAKVPATAPRPTEPMRKPNVLESPPKVSAANIGINDDHGAVKNPIAARSSKRRRVPVKPNA